MTRPHYDWTPLVPDGKDPVPGDVYEIEQLAARLKRTADAITKTTAALKRLGNLESWDSDAGKEFAKKATETAEDVGKAHGRYADAAGALTGYKTSLEGIQKEAEALRKEAKAADEARVKATGQAAHAPEPKPDVQGPTTRESYEKAADAASDRLTAARGELDKLRSRHDRAAKDAANKIGTAMEADGLNDSLLDDLRDALKVISKVCGIIATVCGILSLLVGWIPVIGQALAAVLGTIALIASVISLVCNLLLVMNGDATWEDVMWDAISVASFGVGRVFASAAKLSRLAARSKAWNAAKGLARVRNPNMNSAGIRQATQRLMGGPRQGARDWETLAQAPGGIFKGSGGLRGAYGNLGDELKQVGTFKDEFGKLVSGRTSLSGYLDEVGEAGKLARVNPAVFAHGAEGAAAQALARQGTVQDAISIGATAVGATADAKQAGGLLGDLGSSDGFTGYFTGRSDTDVTGSDARLDRPAGAGPR